MHAIEHHLSNLRHTLATTAVCAAMLAATTALAQQQQPYGLPIHHLTPVEERVGDLGPLSHSLRNVQPGLGVPTGFSQVYRVPGRPDLLMRFDGGVTAVFPESVYVDTEAGARAVVPPNTVFYIGLPQAEALVDFGEDAEDNGLVATGTGEPPIARVFDIQQALPPGSQVGEVTINQRSTAPPISYATNRIQPQPISTRHDLDAGPAIVADEKYRADRMRELLQRAAKSRSEANH